MVTITSAQRDYSTKYQIPLEFQEDTVQKCEVLIEIVVGGIPTTEIYRDVWLAYRDTGGGFGYLFKGDLAPILENAIGYTELTRDFSLPVLYISNVIRVTVTPIDSLPGSAIWEFNAYKHRFDYYEYWFQVQTSVGGIQLPTGAAYPSELNTYFDGEKSTTLQVFNYAVDDEADIIWKFNDGTPNLPEQFDVSTGQAILAQLNIGLDELIEESSVLTLADRSRIAAYQVSSGTGVWDVFVRDLSICKFEPFSLMYVNKWGLWESLVMPSVIRESLIPRKTAYRRRPDTLPNAQSYDPNNYSEILTPVYDYDYMRKFVVMTDWISEYEMEQWRFASTCDVTYVKWTFSAQVFFLPVNIMNREISIKKRHKDKMYSLEMEIELQPLNR